MIPGEVTIKESAEAARTVEMKTFKKHGVYERAPIEECWEETGNGPVGIKWVEAIKCDKEEPKYRCRLVAKTIKKDEREDLLAATPPLAKKMLFSHWASVPGTCLDFGDVIRRANFHTRARREGSGGAVKRGL